MQARFYAPWFGRFLSPDPARDQHFEMTQSWNIYSYVMNDPVMKIDPRGEDYRLADENTYKRFSAGLKKGLKPGEEKFVSFTKQKDGSYMVSVAGKGGSANLQALRRMADPKGQFHFSLKAVDHGKVDPGSRGSGGGSQELLGHTSFKNSQGAEIGPGNQSFGIRLNYKDVEMQVADQSGRKIDPKSALADVGKTTNGAKLTTQVIWHEMRVHADRFSDPKQTEYLEGNRDYAEKVEAETRRNYDSHH